MKPLCIIEYSNRFQIQERVSRTLLHYGLNESNDSFLESIHICCDFNELTEIARRFVILQFINNEGVKV